MDSSVPGDLTWVDYEPFYHYAFNTQASVVVLNNIPNQCPLDKTLVVTQDPKLLFDTIAGCFYDYQFAPRGFFEKLINRKDVHIGKGCRIDKTVSMGKHVYIGDNVEIMPHVTIYDNVTICDNTVIHANSVIGAPAFSHTKQQDGTYVARKSWGNVVIMENVEIAALNTIDRGITGTTLIGPGTKTCGHVHIGHDTWIGSNCYFSGGCTISGYVRIKNDCQFWGQAGVSSSIHIAEGTTVLACAIVMKDVKEPDQTLVGYPAEPKAAHWRREAIVRKMVNEYGGKG